MRPKRDTVEIRVEVTQDDEYGPVYVATNDELGLITHGETFEALLDNLREALDVCLPDAPDLNFVPDPRVVLVMEMPQNAQTA